MQLASARELKAMAREKVLWPMREAVAASASLARSAEPLSRTRSTRPERLMALGIARAPGKSKEFRLAVRLQRHSLHDQPELKRLTEMAKGEIDLRFVGRVHKRATIDDEAPPWYQQRQRPLSIGASVGHFAITAGTLGAFVSRQRDSKSGADRIYILSNNHVLANEDQAKIGDAILQPGRADGGNLRDRVASLTDFVKLKTRGNRVDCAIAEVDLSRIEVTLAELRGLGKLKGASTELLDSGTAVRKVGRTTGVTRGRVSAFEVDDVVVAYSAGNLSFDNQIEIEGIGAGPFSDGGDSGSLIVNARNEGVALLFAGSESGGRNRAGLTYANPLPEVLSALKIELLF